MTHYVGETEQFGPPLSVSAIAEICRQNLGQDRHWWKIYHGQIVGIGSPVSGVFSWRGFVVRSSGDYEIYKPMMLQSTGFLIELRALGTYTDLVHLGALTDDVIASWHEIRRSYDEELAKLKLPPHANGVISPRDRTRTRIVSVDGIPWELHAIANDEARTVAITAYLKEQA